MTSELAFVYLKEKKNKSHVSFLNWHLRNNEPDIIVLLVTIFALSADIIKNNV